MSDLDSFEAKVQSLIGSQGPLEAYRTLIAENDALIRSDALEIGHEIVARRSAIHCLLMADWAEEQQKSAGYERPFAVVAIGGTGREEMTPCSDTDFAFLFDDTIEGNDFLLSLQHQTIQTKEFRNRCGFEGETLPFNLEDASDCPDLKQLNAFLDMKPAYDPTGLAAQFRETIQETYDPFRHFLHVSEHWLEHWGESNSEAERIDRFDIKNEGLRTFLGGVWALAGNRFIHSHEIYPRIDDPDVLPAYYFLLRIRAFLHLQKGTHSNPTATGSHAEDVLYFEDFLSLGDLKGSDASEQEKFEFAIDVRERLLDARRRVDRFACGAIGGELKRGRPIRPGVTLVYGSGGLREDAQLPEEEGREKSRTALGMLLAAQRYGVSIDPSEMERTFLGAGKWLEPVPELGQLFNETLGSLAGSLEFLSQIPGAQERLFPGFSRFEASLDERVMTEKKSLRGALLRQKLRALENDIEEGKRQIEQAMRPEEFTDVAYQFSVPVEAASLDSDHLAAVKLALTTKRLPLTEQDEAAREDEDLPLHLRFSSGISNIPLDRYYEESFRDAGFSKETLEITRFLIENRNAFKERAEQDIMDSSQVETILTACRHSQDLLRALIVFTYADRTEWEGEKENPARWFNIRELYSKARLDSQPDFDPTEKLSQVGFGEKELSILKDFGKDFFEGIYRHYAIRMGGYLIRLEEAARNPGKKPAIPHVTRINVGSSRIVGVAALDVPGIAASISGAFWKEGVGLQQAHLFSATNHGLALDFFHLAPPVEGEEVEEGKLKAAIIGAILERKYIREEDEAALPKVARKVTLRSTASGLYHLRGETKEDVGALLYVLSCRAFRQFSANIYALAAHTGKRGSSRVSVYLSLPDEIDFEEAQAIAEKWE